MGQTGKHESKEKDGNGIGIWLILKPSRKKGSVGNFRRSIKSPSPASGTD